MEKWDSTYDREERMMLVWKEKSLILMFYFGQGIICLLGKDWIGITGPYSIEENFKNILGQPTWKHWKPMYKK